MKKISAFTFSLIFSAIALTACGSTANAPSNTNNPVNTAGGGVQSDTPSATDNKAQTDISKPSETAENNADTASMLSENEAKEIALKDAGVDETAISNYKIKLETDDGIKQYEIDFDAGGYEYDYDIDAASGQILEKDKEPTH